MSFSILFFLHFLFWSVHGFTFRARKSHLDRLDRSTLLHSKSSSQDGSCQSGRSVEKEEQTLEFRLHPSIASIPSEAWNACLTEHSSPFLEHAWLFCLEDSKCASPSTGWVPQHVSVLLDNDTVGFIPLYIKGHSMGEFIFDQQFAEAAYANGIQYYPKILVGVPFTPATGQRILWHPRILTNYSRDEIAQLNKAVGAFLKQLAKSNKLSSVHCNFLTDEEATDLAGPLKLPNEEKENNNVKDQIKDLLDRLAVKDDYLRRTSLQYHWTNENPKQNGAPFVSFDEYLECFKSKRRINIKRERRKVLEDEAIRVDAIIGKDILKYEGLVERMFEIYLSTIDKMVWGRQYLTLDFFMKLAQSDFVENLVFMCARSSKSGNKLKADDVFAGTFNIVKDGVFYGRYWGCLPGREIKNLHFETCYWSAIDFCIRNGLKRMEPGAGGGDYKWARGFNPALIHSVHYITNPGLRRGIAQFLDYETENNVELTQYLLERSAVGKVSAAI